MIYYIQADAGSNGVADDFKVVVWLLGCFLDGLGPAESRRGDFCHTDCLPAKRLLKSDLGGLLGLIT